MPEKPVFTGFFAFLDLCHRYPNTKNAPFLRAILLFSIPSQNYSCGVGAKSRRGCIFSFRGVQTAKKRGQALQLNLNPRAVFELEYHSAIMENRSFFQQPHPQPFVPLFENEGLFFYGLGLLLMT